MAPNTRPLFYYIRSKPTLRIAKIEGIAFINRHKIVSRSLLFGPSYHPFIPAEVKRDTAIATSQLSKKSPPNLPNENPPNENEAADPEARTGLEIPAEKDSQTPGRDLASRLTCSGSSLTFGRDRQTARRWKLPQLSELSLVP